MANRFSDLSAFELAACYEQWIELEYEKGNGPDGKFCDLINAYEADASDDRVAVKAASEDMLMEIARRWYATQSDPRLNHI